MAYNFGVWSILLGGGGFMLTRLLVLPRNRSYFLFGARNTGKSTLVGESCNPDKTLVVNLLDVEQEERLAKNPSELLAIVRALPKHITHVVVDEIQKIPALLNIVHLLMEEKKGLCFVLTGSSARKLKQSSVNLLAGRAFVCHLYPFSCFELGAKFNLDDALRFGTLPKIHGYEADGDKQQFLMAYTQTYLKEEIWYEHLIRKLDPFRRFLEVSAQMNGKIINMSAIANDVGVDDKTIKDYFTLLEDTLVGFILEPFQHSFRKRLRAHPKFYYFDTGVVRALSRQLSVPLLPGTSAYGDAFEHYVILECVRLASYYYPEYRFSYLKTKDDAEVDLVVERPGEKILFIAIKSTTSVTEAQLCSFIKLAEDFGECEAVCFSRDSHAKQLTGVVVLPWQVGLNQYFLRKV